jgi:hypothetical protein
MDQFAARSLSVHCGSKSAHWAAFLKAGHLLKDWKEEMLLDQDPLYLTYVPFIKELEKNSINNPGKSREKSRKQFRSLDEVLLSAVRFAVSNERDTIYAILGMCGVLILSLATLTPAIKDQDVQHNTFGLITRRTFRNLPRFHNLHAGTFQLVERCYGVQLFSWLPNSNTTQRFAIVGNRLARRDL